MRGGSEAAPLLERGEIATRTRAVLNRGGWGNPDVLLVESSAGSVVVVKDFRARAAWVRRLLGPWLIRREIAAYRRLEGIEAVPRYLGRIDPLAFVLEYRPGTLLSRSLADVLRPEFVGELESAIASMHARGVVHLDLRHRSNVLAGEDGHPVVLDFASALRFDPDSSWGRAMIAFFSRFDRSALGKWRVRLTRRGEGSSSSAIADQPSNP